MMSFHPHNYPQRKFVELWKTLIKGLVKHRFLVENSIFAFLNVKAMWIIL